MNDDNLPRAQPLPDLSSAPRTRFLTSWGTVLYVDPESGELRHGPKDTSPANAYFVADPAADATPRRGWIMLDRDGRFEPVTCRTHSSWTAIGGLESAEPTRL